MAFAVVSWPGEHERQRHVQGKRDVLSIAERRRQRDTGKGAPHHGVVDGARQQAQQAQPTERLGAPQSAAGEIAMRYFSLTMLNIDVKLFEGAESCLLDFEVDHLPADVRGFFLERDVAAIVMTVSEFALPVVTREFGRAHNRVHFRARCSTSHCRKRIATHCRCALRSAIC
jgi:hypothetical protein